MRPINRDSLPHLVKCGLGLPSHAISTLSSQALARWWGVQLGKGCRFRGVTTWRRFPGSSIYVGPDTEFRSGKVSNLVGINRGCIISTLSPSAKIVIGHSCGFTGLVIGAAGEVRLGDRVMCGANVTITDTDWHASDPVARHAGEPGRVAPVHIEDDVWLGLNVIVLKGVTIGARTIVGAGSVVTRSLPADVIASGNPAKAHVRGSARPEYVHSLSAGD